MFGAAVGCARNLAPHPGNMAPNRSQSKKIGIHTDNRPRVLPIIFRPLGPPFKNKLPSPLGGSRCFPVVGFVDSV